MTSIIDNYATFELNDRVTITGNKGRLNNRATGVFTIPKGKTASIELDFHNYGGMVNRNSITIMKYTEEDQGKLDSEGSIQVASLFSILGGLVLGTGSLIGDVINAGIVSVGCVTRGNVGRLRW